MIWSAFGPWRVVLRQTGAETSASSMSTIIMPKILWSSSDVRIDTRHAFALRFCVVGRHVFVETGRLARLRSARRPVETQFRDALPMNVRLPQDRMRDLFVDEDLVKPEMRSSSPSGKTMRFGFDCAL